MGLACGVLWYERGWVGGSGVVCKPYVPSILCTSTKSRESIHLSLVEQWEVGAMMSCMGQLFIMVVRTLFVCYKLCLSFSLLFSFADCMASGAVLVEEAAAMDLGKVM